jgi:hypothetical protein
MSLRAWSNSPLHGVQQPEWVERHGDGDRARADPIPQLSAAADRLRHRCGAPHRRRGTPAEDLEQLPLIAGTAGVLGSPAPGLVRVGYQAFGPPDPGPQAPRPAQPEVVAALPEYAQRRVRDLSCLRDSPARFHLEPYELLLDASAGLQARIVLGGGALDCLLEDAVGLLEPAGLEEGDPERGKED